MQNAAEKKRYFLVSHDYLLKKLGCLSSTLIMAQNAEVI